MKIPLPSSYQAPDGVKPGQSFDAVATITLQEDGTYDLTAIDGVPVGSEEEEEEDEQEPRPPAPGGAPQEGTPARMPMPWDNQ